MVLKVLGFVLTLLVFLNAKPFENVEDEAICGYDACPAYDPNALNVHIICHSHDDVGWLKTVDQYYFQDVLSVIGSVVQALKQNENRRFVQVETAFFKMWWDQQTEAVRQNTRDLVANGQLEIINAAWSMNDEAAVHYQSTIDQFTLGLRFMEDNLGTCARPRVGWQIDPFGHSKEHASISARLGFDSLFFARLDYRDRSERHGRGASDLLWRASSNLGNTSDIFTSAFYSHYSAPGGFCFDIGCGDDPIIDDEESPDYNLNKKVEDFAKDVSGKAAAYPSNNVLITMGDDFRYQGAITTYINLDRLIEGFNKHPQEADGKPVKVYYSTPSCYAKAVNQWANDNDEKLEIKTDDFMPYADGPNTYWTGYFTSRPASKRFERQSNNLLQVAKQLSASSGGAYDNSNINSLKEAIGIMQHHDAITGTEKQHVTNNYHLILTRAIENTISEAGNILATIIAGGEQDDSLGLTSCLLANVSSCLESSADKFTLVVYNPLSHTVSSPVNVPVNFDQWSIQDPSGSAVRFQVTDLIRDFSYVTDATPTAYSLVFVAEDLPPQGFKVYQLTAIPRKEDDKKIDTMPKTEKVEPLEQIGYDDTNFDIDDSTGLLKSITMNGVTVDVTQDYLYYSSQDSSGAYIFVPKGDAKRLNDGPIKTTRIDGLIYQGVLQDFGDSAKQIIKVYNHDRSFIEIDWVVGPLDISQDNIGKELISRFTTSISSSDTWFTDSNGREMQKRVKNHRDTYTYSNEQPVSGNYYPVNSKIVIKDESEQTEFAVITDRSQGGSSLSSGELELMVLRACHHDDGRGVGESLNEQQYGTGLVIRGQHYLVLGPANGDGQKSTAAIEREIALRTLLNSWTFVTDKDVSSNLKTLEWSNLKTSLPDNVHVLTLEPWNDNQVVIRLEHILENGEDEELAQEVTVDLSDLFTTFTVSELKETLLGANLPLEEHTPLHWPGAELNQEGSSILYKDERMKRDVDDLKITLAPMQIRTFIASVTYNN